VSHFGGLQSPREGHVGADSWGRAGREVREKAQVACLIENTTFEEWQDSAVVLVDLDRFLCRDGLLDGLVLLDWAEEVTIDPL